jgi:O-methyltransferase involved in polyketide biosynthesis
MVRQWQLAAELNYYRLCSRGDQMVNTGGTTSRGVHSDVPNVARIYDCLLGGKNNFAADRAAAAKIAEAAPEVVRRVRENREFLGRVVRFLAASGLRQFLDIGTGLPTQENVHQVARRLAPAARVVYVDNDPVVVSHAQALLATDPGTTAIEADLREPSAILRLVTEQGLIDLAQPVAILMLAVLHFIPDTAQTTQIVATFREQMAAGSYLAITHATAGNMSAGNLAQAVQTYSTSSAGSITPRSHEQIKALFGELEIEEPGVVPVAHWRPGQHTPQLAEPGVIQFPGRQAATTAQPATDGPVFLGGLARRTAGVRERYRESDSARLRIDSAT